jgi:D-3-phosphoglycerate dehydrogenase / 2-oxoglutarate reductase
MDLKKFRVLVTPNSFGKYNPKLKLNLENRVGSVIYNTTGKPLSSAQLAELLPNVHGFIAGLDTIDRNALQAADSLKIIARYGVGVDRVDLKATRDKGIIVSNTPGANAASVAELALGMILMLARQIPTAQKLLQEGEWPRMPGVTLKDKVIGIIGLGAIGKQLAKRLSAFESNLIAYDPYPDINFSKQYHIDLISLDALISKSDFISLHVPVLPETREMVNDAFITKMKKGSYLINTSRGEIVDEPALLKGLESGRIHGAALDAFKTEPPNRDNPLLSHTRVICTPHLGAQTDGSTNTMGEMALNECLRVLAGGKPEYQVN